MYTVHIYCILIIILILVIYYLISQIGRPVLCYCIMLYSLAMYYTVRLYRLILPTYLHVGLPTARTSS